MTSLRGKAPFLVSNTGGNTLDMMHLPSLCVAWRGVTSEAMSGRGLYYLTTTSLPQRCRDKLLITSV